MKRSLLCIAVLNSMLLGSLSLYADYQVAERQEDTRSIITKLQHAYKAWRYAKPTKDLFDAVRTGKTDEAEAALKNGALANMIYTFPSDKGESYSGYCYYVSGTALGIATYKGDTSMIKLLLERGAKPNLRDRRKDSPLDIAINSSKISDGTTLEVIQRLVEHGATFDQKSETYLLDALYKNKIMTARHLFAKCDCSILVDRDSCYINLINKSIISDDDTLEIVQLLRANGAAYFDLKGGAYLRETLRTKKIKTARHLLDKCGSSVLFDRDYYHGTTALHEAVSCPEILEELLGYYANRDTQYSLVDKINTFNITDKHGETPYHGIYTGHDGTDADMALALYNAGVPGIDHQDKVDHYPRVFIIGINNCFRAIKALSEYSDRKNSSPSLGELVAKYREDLNDIFAGHLQVIPCMELPNYDLSKAAALLLDEFKAQPERKKVKQRSTNHK